MSSEPVQRHQTGFGAGAMVGVQRPSYALHGGRSHQAAAEDPAGQHQGQEHHRQSPERTHHRQPAPSAPGRGNHAGQTISFLTV